MPVANLFQIGDVFRRDLIEQRKTLARQGPVVAWPIAVGDGRCLRRRGRRSRCRRLDIGVCRPLCASRV